MKRVVLVPWTQPPAPRKGFIYRNDAIANAKAGRTWLGWYIEVPQ